MACGMERGNANRSSGRAPAITTQQEKHMNGLETLWGGTVIAVGNQKGGVGKTTTAVHIARGLANRGHRTVLWDLDPSAGATKHLGLSPDVYAGTLELLLGEVTPTEAVVSRGETDPWLPDRLDLIPAKRRLETIDAELAARSRFWNRLDVLGDALQTLRDRYDVIVLDTPPSTVLSPALSAYAHANWFLLAATPDPLAITGLADAFRDMTAVRSGPNPKLQLLGVVLNAVDIRTRLARELLAYVDQTFAMPQGNTFRFTPAISRSTVVPTAQKVGRPVPDAFPDHPVAREFGELAESVETRLVLAQRGLGSLTDEEVDDELPI